MCWNGEASAALASAGFATAGYLARKGEPLWVPLAYFACMEYCRLRFASPTAKQGDPRKQRQRPVSMKPSSESATFCRI
jgi:hypothetical protein